MKSIKALKDLFSSKTVSPKSDIVLPNIDIDVTNTDDSEIITEEEPDTELRKTVTPYKGFNVELLLNLCQNENIDQIRRFVHKNNQALFQYDVKDLNTDFKLKDLKFYKKNGKIILSKNYYKSKVENINKQDKLIIELKNEVDELKNQLNIYLEFVNKIKDAFEEKLPSIFCEFDSRITEIENRYAPRKNF